MDLSFLESFSLNALIFTSLFVTVGFMVSILLIGWIYSEKKIIVLSPFTNTPVRRFDSLSYISIARVKDFMTKFSGYDNRMFDIHRALICRDTGRVFQDAITWYGRMHLDWSFLHKRYPGHYVSWGSLTGDHQREIMNAHESLDGFQTEFSSPSPSPKDVEPEYIYMKPGPLYVNLETKELLGWKCVPDSEIEVLIVQKPKESLALPKYKKEEELAFEKKRKVRKR